VETVNPAWDPYAAKGAPPRNRVRFAACLRAEWIRGLQPAPDNLIDLFLKIDERLFHSRVRVTERYKGDKGA
jgi:hypothetical protein